MPELGLLLKERVATEARAKEILQAKQQFIYRRTDRLFAGLLHFEWLVAIAGSIWLTPRVWSGSESQIHVHVWASLILGSVIIVFPVLLALFYPGRTVTRHSIGIAQMLMGALWIHISGGRIETHFYIFGSLAFLAFYRDWHVLVSASAVVALDHLLRGLFWPQSVFGVVATSPWRWLEHAGWVVFENVFLIQSCLQSRKEMDSDAHRQAELEATQSRIEQTVITRTAELSQSHEENERLLKAVSSALIWLNKDGIVQRWNLAAESILGLSAAATVGQPFWDCRIAWRDPLSTSRILDCLKASRPVHLDDLWVTNAQGQDRAFSLIAHPIIEGDGANSGLLLLGRDVTEHKTLEEELRRAQKLESVGQLAAGIAHEINTPIQYVGDNIGFLRNAFADICGVVVKQEELRTRLKWGTLDDSVMNDVEQTVASADLTFLIDEVPRAIEQTLEGIGRVAKIVRAMKEFSHPGAEGKVASNLNSLIENTITVARNEWKYVADLTTDFDESLPLIPCFAGEFNQVILNLIVNAAHAIGDRTNVDASQKGLITISTRSLADRAEIRVKDNGTGIPERVRGRVFDPFFTTKPVGKGTGQGLAIAHAAIVKKHNGQLSFETEMGQGTTFIIQLPSADSTAYETHDSNASIILQDASCG